MAKTKPILQETVRVGAKHHVTVPHRISKALNLKEGDHLLLRVVDHRLEMIPVRLIPKDQLWYWTPEWQQMEREADEDIAQGRIKESDSVHDFLRELKS